VVEDWTERKTNGEREEKSGYRFLKMQESE
jgi:hypothetical protein